MTLVVHLRPHVGVFPLAEIDSSGFLTVDIDAAEIATVRRLKALSSKGKGAGESRHFDGRHDRRNGRAKVIGRDVKHCHAIGEGADDREVVKEPPLLTEQPQNAAGCRNDLHLTPT